ncbi:MAG: YggT family protein [Candidatus Eisenbacteria bacterium]
MSLSSFLYILHLAVRYLAFGLIALLILRMIVQPERLRFGTRSVRYRLARATDFIVLPIHSMLPPGTSAAVAAVLAMMAVLLVAYFAVGFLDDTVGAAARAGASLLGGAPLAAVGYLLYGLVSVYTTLLILRIFLSWFRVGPWGGGRFTRFLYQATEPLLAPVRGILPPLGMIDLSPILVFVLLHFLKGAILSFFIRG